MVIYYINEEIRNNVILDIDKVKQITFSSFDLFLFKFPKLKTLTYAYYKESEEKVKLSYVYDCFKDIDSIEYFDSKKHKDLLKNDSIYKSIIVKYIRNTHIWCNILVFLQPYFFDSKYLLLGEYQKVALECTNTFFKTQTMHYVGLVNGVRESQERMNIFNQFFTERNKIEKEYFDSILESINRNKSQSLVAYGYYNKIEVYNRNTELILQIELGLDGLHEINTLFPKSKKVKSEKESKRLATNILVKSTELVSLYNKLLTKDYIRLTNNYLKELDKLKKTNIYKILKASIKQILVDLNKEEIGTYFNGRLIDGYFTHNGLVERVKMNITEKNHFLRLQRNIFIPIGNITKEIELSSYMTLNDFNENADYLLMCGLINIGHPDHKHNLYEYELLANNLNDNFSLAFLKATNYDSMKYFDDYISMQNSLIDDIKYHQQNNQNIKDTRIENNHNSNFNTMFELIDYTNDNELFNENRESRLKNKNNLALKFKKSITKYI